MFGLNPAASSPALAKAVSISSCVKFLLWRKAVRLSSGEAATDGSWRTNGRVQRVGFLEEEAIAAPKPYR